MSIENGEGYFGLTGNEVGIATESVKTSAGFTSDVDVAGFDGKLVGNCLGGEYIDVDVSGKLLAGGSFSSTIGAALVMVNAMEDRITGSVTAGTLVIKKIDDEKDNQGNNNISFSARYYPDIASV